MRLAGHFSLKFISAAARSVCYVPIGRSGKLRVNSNLSKTRHNPAGSNVNEALTGAEVRILFVYGWFTIEITSLFCFISS